MQVRTQILQKVALAPTALHLMSETEYNDEKLKRLSK